MAHQRIVQFRARTAASRPCFGSCLESETGNHGGSPKWLVWPAPEGRVPDSEHSYGKGACSGSFSAFIASVSSQYLGRHI